MIVRDYYTAHHRIRLGDLVQAGHVSGRQRTYLSLNRTGLAGSTFELDDRLVASVGANASLAVIEGAGHACHLEAPDAFAKTVTGFLAAAY